MDEWFYARWSNSHPGICSAKAGLAIIVLRRFRVFAGVAPIAMGALGVGAAEAAAVAVAAAA